MTTMIVRKHNSSGPEDYAGADPGDDVCPNCNLYTSGGYLHCDQCGIRLAPSAGWPEMTGPAVYCPADGAGMPLDARYCGYCGRMLTGQAHAQAFQETTPAVPADAPYPVSSSGRRPCPCGCRAPQGRGWNTAEGRAQAAWLQDGRDQQADDRDQPYADDWVAARDQPVLDADGAYNIAFPAGRAAYLEDVCGFAPRAGDDSGGWLSDAAEEAEAECTQAEHEAAREALDERSTPQAAAEWQRTRLAADLARKRLEARRSHFDGLSQPNLGLPPTEAMPEQGSVMDDMFPDLRLPRGADDTMTDIRGRSRW
jgi:hypothetical protein